MTFIKAFGIYRTYRGRYAIALDVSDDKKIFGRLTSGISYAKSEFALMKAEAFVHSLYKDFIDFRGIPIHFEFKNMGLIN